MNKKRITLIVGLGLATAFGWAQIPSSQSKQPLKGYRSMGNATVVYYTVRGDSGSSYSSDGSYSSSSYSSSSYSSGGSSYGK